MKLLTLAVLLSISVGCIGLKPHRGGKAATSFSPSGSIEQSTVQQSDNPDTPSTQTHENVVEESYVIPTGSVLREEKVEPPKRSGQPSVTNRMETKVSEPMPVTKRITAKVMTQVGAAQKDTSRSIAVKLQAMRPVQWVGIVLILAAAALAYFQWWTKAAIAAGIGIGMIVLAAIVPGNEGLILGVGLAVFAIACLLVLYAYSKGQLDKNKDGIPDFLQGKQN